MSQARPHDTDLSETWQHIKRQTARPYFGPVIYFLR